MNRTYAITCLLNKIQLKEEFFKQKDALYKNASEARTPEASFVSVFIFFNNNHNNAYY